MQAPCRAEQRLMHRTPTVLPLGIIEDAAQAIAFALGDVLRHIGEGKSYRQAAFEFCRGRRSRSGRSQMREPENRGWDSSSQREAKWPLFMLAPALPDRQTARKGA
jgi:hypothetical protein